MENKTRVSRFSESEYGIMKSLFKDSDELIYLIRKAMFFGGLSEMEVNQLESIFQKDEVYNMVKKVFIPEITNEDPYQQVLDTWLTLDLKDKMPGEVEVMIQARNRSNKLMSDAIKRLKYPSAEKVDVLEYEPTDDETENHIELVARNTFINGVTIQLSNLKVMSKREEETPEETLKKLQANSSK